MKFSIKPIRRSISPEELEIRQFFKSISNAICDTPVKPYFKSLDAAMQWEPLKPGIEAVNNKYAKAYKAGE